MGSELKLAGRRALVTGSDTGIGRELALEFGRQGADVVLHYSDHKDGAMSPAEEIKAMGGGKCRIRRSLRTTHRRGQAGDISMRRRPRIHGGTNNYSGNGGTVALLR